MHPHDNGIDDRGLAHDLPRMVSCRAVPATTEMTLIDVAGGSAEDRITLALDVGV